MRTNTLNKIINKYSSWLQYEAQFIDTLPDTGDDPMDEDCEYDIVLDEDNIQVILEYEIGTIYIVGLTKEEQEYITNHA